MIAVPLGLLATPAALDALAATPTTEHMFSFPLSFIPMVGVPFVIIMHLTALLQLRERRAPTAGSLVHRVPRSTSRCEEAA